MALITMTPEGVQRANVKRTPFFQEARAALIGAGFQPTTWVDYLSGKTASGRKIFITIHSSRVVVTESGRFMFSSKRIQRIIDLMVGSSDDSLAIPSQPQ